MFKFNKLLVVAAFALTSALGQNAFAENTGVTEANPTEATITVLNEQAIPEIPAIDDVLETDGEFIIVDDAIIGDELSADQLRGLLTKVHGRHGIRRGWPKCPRCKFPTNGRVGHCNGGDKLLNCRRR